MQNIFLAIVIMVLSACGSQTFLNETSGLQKVPLNVSYDTTDDGIHLAWSVNWDATSFDIWRGTNEATLALYVSNLGQTRWIDIDAIPGQEYTYYLKVYNHQGRQLGESFPQKGFRSYQDYADMEAPRALKADIRRFPDRVTLEWFGQEVSRFRIYRSTDGASGAYTILDESSDFIYIDTNVKPGQTFHYKMSTIGRDYSVNSQSRSTAVKERFYNGTIEGASTLSEGLSILGQTSDAPMGVKATTISDSIAKQGAIQITWDLDPQAEFSRVYRSDRADGDYTLIAPYVRSSISIDGEDYSVFVDRGMDVTGKTNTSVSPPRFEYPSHYYKVSFVKNGDESDLSTVAMGSALNPKDVIAAPNDFVANIRVATNNNFDPKVVLPVISSSTKNYELIFQWTAPMGVSDNFGYFIVASNTVTSRTNLLNAVILPKSTTSYSIPNPEFGEEFRYSIYAMNLDKGGIGGFENSILYKSSTPMPPNFDEASKLRRVVTTNEVTTNAPTHTYYRSLLWPSDTLIRSVGAVTKVWVTKSEVGDIELKVTPDSPATQSLYNFYRRLKGSNDKWQLIITADQQANLDDPNIALQQVVYDTNFTPAQYKGSGGTSLDSFYPIWEYAVTAVNGSRESALSVIREGQAIDPKDLLPAPSYLSVPFHFASGTGISAFSGYWTVVAATPATTGLEQIVGKGGESTETQRMFLTWDAINVEGHVPNDTFNYDVSHARPGKDYSDPESWYHHENIEGQTFIKLDNQDNGDHKTGLYTIVDSGIGVAFVGSYSPETAAFSVRATNNIAAGLEGDSISILFEESPINPYNHLNSHNTIVTDGPKTVTASLNTSEYPYAVDINWTSVNGAKGYQVMVATDADIHATSGGKTVTNFIRVDDPFSEMTTSNTNYTYQPTEEFGLGQKYYFLVATVRGIGSVAGNNSTSYLHRRPYKPVLSNFSTNKIYYTTNYTTGLDITTKVSNTAFEDGEVKFVDKNRKLGSIVRMWEVTAKGDRIELDIAYQRLTQLPQTYILYRATTVSGPWTRISIPVPNTPMGKVTYVDDVPLPNVGRYYYAVSAIYDNLEGVTSDISRDAVGVALEDRRLSPPPDYLSIPHMWAFGQNGYQGKIFATESTHQGGGQIAGGQSKGNYTWFTWAEATKGASPTYTLIQGVSTAHTATEPVFLTTKTLLGGSTLTKFEASSKDIGLYHSYETNSAGYKRDTISMEVVVSNYFMEFTGSKITVRAGSRGFEFVEPANPYDDEDLEAPTGVTASLNKNTYATKNMYTVDLKWNSSLGAQGYTILLKNLQNNSISFLSNIIAPVDDPSTYNVALPATNLSLGTSYEYYVIATNFDPPKKGGTNSVGYSHITPQPPVIRSVSTNSRGEFTNITTHNEPLRVYWGTSASSSMITGGVSRRWTITAEDKGIINIKWDKHHSGEVPDYYKIYRTSNPNRPNDLISDDMSKWESPKYLGLVAGTLSPTYRDNLLLSTTAEQRKGAGITFMYPLYFYRITAVKRVNGVEIESVPSYFTNLSTGHRGIAAAGSAINPEDIYTAPNYVNVVFDYSKSTGWGNYKVFTGAQSPQGIELFGTRTRGSFSYPPNPFWIAWGTSDSDRYARFWVRKSFRASREWPGFDNLNMTDHNYSGSLSTTTHVATQEKPTSNRFIEYSNSGSLSGGNPNTTLYDISARAGGAGIEVTSVNLNIVLDGLPLKGESRGLWYYQTNY